MNQAYQYKIDDKDIKSSPFASIVVKNDGTIQFVNDMTFDLFKYNSKDLSNISIFETLFSSFNEEDGQTFLNNIQNGFIKQMSVTTKDRAIISTNIIFTTTVFRGENCILMTILPSDVSNVSASQHELVDLRNTIESLFMTVTLDEEGFIKGCNSAFLKTSNWTPKRVLGKTLWRLFPETEEGRKQAQTVWDTINSGQVFQNEVKKITKDGLNYWVQLTAIPTIDDQTQKKQFLLIERDITKDKTIQLQLEKIAFIDAETGLMNVHRLEREINTMIEERRHFSFVYMGIDKFYTLKDIQDESNESNLIIEFTKRLKMYFQDSLMARINEHDFVVITPLPEWFIQGFLTYLIQNPLYDAQNVAIPLSISGGITRFPEDQTSFTQLMQASIASITNVREAGGNKIVSLSSSVQQALNRKSMIEKRLLVALDQKNLQVLYQPQMHLSSGKYTAVEAFVRWDDEVVGVVSPDELIPIAEETGLINQIGTFMLEQACLQAVEWQRNNIPLKISINSSVREFRDKNMAKSILDTLARTNCPAELIQIEITEKFALEAESEASIIRQMRQLENEGIIFILDDFGTGYASFRYMQLLPIEVIKIDRTFTNSMLKTEKTEHLVDGMIQLCKSMNFKVLAEGVETEEQVELLKQFGCDYIQGYYLSKPTKADAIEQLYTNRA